jgi:hypothetical protein
MISSEPANAEAKQTSTAEDPTISLIVAQVAMERLIDKTRNNVTPPARSDREAEVPPGEVTAGVLTACKSASTP